MSPFISRLCLAILCLHKIPKRDVCLNVMTMQLHYNKILGLSPKTEEGHRARPVPLWKSGGYPAGRSRVLPWQHGNVDWAIDKCVTEIFRNTPRTADIPVRGDTSRVCTGPGAQEGPSKGSGWSLPGSSWGRLPISCPPHGTCILE